TGKSWFPGEAMLSIVMHAALLGACAWYFQNPLTTNIIADGEGQGGGDNAIEVSTIDGRLLGFTPPRAVSSVGDEENTPNNELVSTVAPPPDPNAVVLPATKSTPTPKEKLTTDRPTPNQTAQFVSPTPLRGRSDTSVEVGRTFGSLNAGVGVSSGVNLGPSGVPGGSAYGRLIQNILSRNYNPPMLNDASGTQYVIVQLRIARDGRILSLVNGRIAPNYFKRRCGNDLINNAAERAVIASNPLPPFPNGFLMGGQEGVAEVLFRYPK
ncbi:MAG TPA: TonB C-terminal domain-containing protein, partial [Blastocatellia bacterium]|nr:TonB C-terminal domain-containing protein [Blastocatellia bacterium]